MSASETENTHETTTGRPQIVICGVRKCGTTSLFRWLGAHPDVCAASVKETRFLMDRDSPYCELERSIHAQGIDGYGQFWEHWDGERFRLEATSRYFDQETSLRTLSGLDEPPHAVFVLRDPVRRLISAFEYARNNRGTVRADVTLAAFVDALENGTTDALLTPDDGSRFSQETRREVSQLPRELDYGRYLQRLAAWKASYPADRLHVLLFERLRDTPRKFTQDLARTLGLDPAFYDGFEFRRENATVRVRSHVLHKLVRRAAPFVPRVGWTRSAYKTYLRLQEVRRRSATADPTVERLRAIYAEPNRQLADAFGLDLSPWESPAQ